MIELTHEQRQAVKQNPNQPVRLVDPESQEAFVLLRAEVYERLQIGEYDDSPWTDEEMDLLAAEAGEMLDSFGKDS